MLLLEGVYAKGTKDSPSKYSETFKRYTRSEVYYKLCSCIILIKNELFKHTQNLGEMAFVTERLISSTLSFVNVWPTASTSVNYIGITRRRSENSMINNLDTA